MCTKRRKKGIRNIYWARGSRTEMERVTIERYITSTLMMKERMKTEEAQTEAESDINEPEEATEAL